MILDLKFTKDERTGAILDQVSDYNPSEAVKQRTQQVMSDFAVANTLRNKPYMEFNQYALMDRINLDQLSWNQFTTQPSSDPAQQWRSQAFRPIVRNKIISIAAQLTASVIYPVIYAQNEHDEEDQDAGMVMRDLIEWVEENYEYDRMFMNAVIAAMVQPACFIHTEFAEKFREIKMMQPDGTWKVKKVLDELFSGFRCNVVPCDELWIADFYTQDIQKQPYLIWRKVVDFTTAKAVYGSKENFKYVQPGLQYLYANQQSLFYQVYDQNLMDRLAEVVIYYNRSADLQLTFVNGVLMDDVDQPNPRQDKKYPFVKSGYELLDAGRFFYYKSLAFKTAPDEVVINTLYRMMIDGTYMQIMPPAVVFGDTVINSSVTIPGSVTTIDTDDPKASFQTIQTNNNLSAAFEMINKVEASVTESTTQNLNPGVRQTAFTTAALEQQSKTLLGLFAKMIGFMVKDLGDLMVSDILQFLTVGDVMDIESEVNRIKFKNFILPDKTIDGKSKSRKIEFNMDLPDQVNKDQEMEISKKIFNKEKQFNNDTQIIQVNPTLFRKMKFRVAVRPEALAPKSDLTKKALALEEYGLAMANPLTEKEAITRDLLLASFEATREDPDKYMMKSQPGQQPGMPGQPGQGMPPQPPQGGQPQPVGVPPPGAMMGKAMGTEVPPGTPSRPKF